VGRELYAMTLDRIERIQAAVRLTPLPSHIAYFDGMADVGDAIVPVIDLRRQQGAELQPFDTTERPPCILTLLEGAMTGILVDQVLSIVDIPPERLEPVREASRLPISHVVALDGQLMALLTLDRLLPPAAAEGKSHVPAPRAADGKMLG
jgi:chemotaxis signal transduction protein